MPQSEGWQASTTIRFQARAGASCAFSLLQGFNMSDLARFALYTGSPPGPAVNGGASGPLDSARVGALAIARLAAKRPAP